MVGKGLSLSVRTLFCLEILVIALLCLGNTTQQQRTLCVSCETQAGLTHSGSM